MISKYERFKKALKDLDSSRIGSCSRPSDKVILIGDNEDGTFFIQQLENVTVTDLLLIHRWIDDNFVKENDNGKTLPRD